VSPRRTSNLARIGAPLAFLLAATVLVLLVDSALESGEPVSATGPGETETAPATTEPEVEPEPEPEPTPAAPTETEPADEPGAEYHEIQAGDTLAAIASRYGTAVERLLELNPGVDPVALTVGQRIRVS
jgi:LysM repeat protein